MTNSQNSLQHDSQHDSQQGQAPARDLEFPSVTSLRREPFPTSKRPRLHVAHRSLVVIVDLQERLVPVIPDHVSIIESTRLLLDAASILQVPAVATEQYPKGLGTTMADLANHPALQKTSEKLRFSAAEELEIDGWLKPLSTSFQPDTARQIILAGIETHICILQTALELISRGQQVTLLVDATGSRRKLDQQTALERMQLAGVTLATVESILFEWCEVAGTDSFKAISRLVRNRT